MSVAGSSAVGNSGKWLRSKGGIETWCDRVPVFGRFLGDQVFDQQALQNEVRRKAASTVQHAPRYTCTESIERYWYATRKGAPPKCDANLAPQINDQNLERSDRLRLDVAVGSGQEIFSWHGQKSFQTEEIDQLVTAGPASSGNYFSFLSSIFLKGTVKIDFVGVRNEGNKQIALFRYAVPVNQSHFETRTAKGNELLATMANSLSTLRPVTCSGSTFALTRCPRPLRLAALIQRHAMKPRT